MAVQNDHLLSLLLAYSAAHRARLLQHPEPATRIAIWTQDIFPALRHALADPAGKAAISIANIATAIMLASLEIISPTAFGYAIPWHAHLSLARELIAARPQGLRVSAAALAHGGSEAEEEEQVHSFLWSWFAYLDVFGALSGAPRDVGPAWILDYKVYDPEDDDEIDCIMGFTTRCIYLLAQMAELARRCDALRPGAGEAVEPPPQDMLDEADKLERELRDSLTSPRRACAHLRRSGAVAKWDSAQMGAVDEAYHFAALMTLQRRIRGHARDSAPVAEALEGLLGCLARVDPTGSAESCLLWPLFTAGCEAEDPAVRQGILDRMVKLEDGCGMTQVRKGRALMQMVWEKGSDWIDLVAGEFIG
jgi:hypothetical protein